jgi:hypothetical protein
VTPDENIDPGRYGFKIFNDEGKTHYFSSEEQIVIREWMKALMKATITRDYKSTYLDARLHQFDGQGELTVHRARRFFREHPHHPALCRANDEPRTAPTEPDPTRRNPTRYAPREYYSIVHPGRENFDGHSER